MKVELEYGETDMVLNPEDFGYDPFDNEEFDTAFCELCESVEFQLEEARAAVTKAAADFLGFGGTRAELLALISEVL